MDVRPIEKRELRWLLRALCDPPFLRLYVEAAEVTNSEIEHLFFYALDPDSEHRDEHREGAWSHLHKLLGDHLDAPMLFQRLYRRLDEHLRVTADDEQRSLPAFYGVGFLFVSECATPPPSSCDIPLSATQPVDPTASSGNTESQTCVNASPPHTYYWELPATASAPTTCADDLAGYVETHAHFRACVPQSVHWLRLMSDIRLRARHRKATVKVGVWKRTRAELLDLAHERSCVLSPEGDWSAAIEAALVNLRDSTQAPCPGAVALLAVRANFGRHLTYQRGVEGLTRFTEHYDRFSRSSKRSPGARAKIRDDIEQIVAALERFRRCGVQAVELRPTTENTRIELQRKLYPLVLGYFCHLQEANYHGVAPIRLGLVPSLFKQQLSNNRSTHTIDGSLCSDWVDEQIRLWRHHVMGLLDILETVPPIRLFVVGLDAAGREQGCPVRDFAPAFDLVHAYHRRHGLCDHTPGRRLSSWVARLRAMLPAETERDRQLGEAQKLWETLNDDYAAAIPRIRLGLTMHAGEDFVDPVSGLRELWDAISHLGLRRGDRLGHALAASLNKDLLDQLLARRADSSNPFVTPLPGREHHYRVTKPLGVHLLDTAWEFQRLAESQGARPRPGDLLHAASHAFSVPAEARPLSAQLSRSRPAAPRVPGLHFYELEQTPPDLRTELTIDDGYRRRFELLRQQVLRRICRRGLFIESCPTSNIVVAGLKTPPLEVFRREAANNVTVASDDPAIFNAWPDQELRRYGGDDESRARLFENSMQATFI